MFKLCFFVPETHLEQVKQSLFAAGAGRMGYYEHCCWQTLGSGQFRSMQGSNPYLGKAGELETLPEWKVEMVMTDEVVEQVLMALKDSHPYETPAFEYWKLANQN